MKPAAITLLRATLAVLLSGTFLAQCLIPVEASSTGATYPEVAHLVVPYSAAAILALVGVQAALVAVWRLLTLVSVGQVFTPRALRWVDLVVAGAALWTVLSGVVLVHLVAVVGVGGPGAALGLAACVVCGVAVALLMIVMRGLLQTATSDRSELAEVI